MTDTEQTQCAALAKRIAELRPDWAVAGCAVRDPKTGWRWRCQTGYWDYDDEDQVECLGVPIADSEPGQRALAAGPDWRDDATVGALLMRYLPEHELTCFGNGWRCVQGLPRGTVYGTRAEAILAAVVAALGGQDGK